jgi:hypothetical protein
LHARIDASPRLGSDRPGKVPRELLRNSARLTNA